MSSKNVLILLPLLFALAFNASHAEAASGELLAGKGLTDPVYGTDFYQVRVNVVEPVFRRIDAFFGVEYSKSHEDGEMDGTRYSYYVPAVAFGLRFKPVVGDRFQLYLALAGVAGKVYYKTNLNDTTLSTVSIKQDKPSFLVPRLGVGASFKLGARTTILAEASITAQLPDYEAVVTDTSSGSTYNQTLESGPMVGLMLGLRQAF